MNIETILEGWLIPDERYPPFKTDDLVKLAFSIEETELKESDSDTLYFRIHTEDQVSGNKMSMK